MNYHSPAALGFTFPYGENQEQYQVTHISITTEYNFIYATLDDEKGNIIKDVAITTKESKLPHYYCPCWYSVGSLFLNNESGKWYVVTQINYYIESITEEKLIVYLLRNSVGDFMQLREDVLKERVSDQRYEFISTRNKLYKPYDWDKENTALEKQFKQEPLWYNDYKKGMD